MLRTKNELRDIDLNVILPWLGAEEKADRREQHRRYWRTDKGLVSVYQGRKFSIDFTSLGGGGAIDLVMALLDYSFIGALKWLTEHFGDKRIDVDEAETVQITEPITTVHYVDQRDNFAEAKARMMHYLIGTRKLSPELVNAGYEQGFIYPNGQGGVVFVHYDAQKKAIGCTVRGVFSDFKQVRNRNGSWFIIGSWNADKVYIFESPIDLLSYCTLKGYDPKSLYLSLAGNSISQILRPLLQGKMIVRCTDNPEHESSVEARTASERLGAELRSLARAGCFRDDLPVSDKDWNDVLVNGK